MKKPIYLLSLFVMTFCGPLASAEEIDNDALSETLGHLLVRGLDTAGFTFNFDKVISGIRDERAGKPAPLTEEEYEQAMYTIQEKHFLQTAEKNLSEANVFLATNAEEKNVHCLEPQLQYRIEKEGEGPTVGAESVPLIHYTGKLLDGTVFASSEEIGQPVALPVKQSMPGLSKGLLGMKEGEKRTLYIHPELAHGLSQQLPPNALLIFEVEVVKAHSVSLEDLAQQTVTPPAAVQ